MAAINKSPAESILRVTSEAWKILQEIQDCQSSLQNALYSARVLLLNDNAFPIIHEYVKNSQVHGYGVKIEKIVRIICEKGKEFQQCEATKHKFRMMLWHGTKKCRVMSILQDGFHLPPSKRQMFGTGIYFADRVSKSCNYCDNTNPGETAYLFLCDVLLGKMYKVKNANSDISKVANFREQYGSVKCPGKFVPDRSENCDIDGSIAPCGQTIPNIRFPSYSLNYNEYIVYDTKRINIKFLVKVKFMPFEYYENDYQ